MTENLAWKVLNNDGSARMGVGSWPLPTKNPGGEWIPGDWISVEGELAPCANGLHICMSLRDVIAGGWVGPALFRAEYDPSEVIDSAHKSVVRRARLVERVENWNSRTARLFACDCAERVAHLAGDERSAEAIKVSRRYAVGKATNKELAAARAAARDAVCDSARAAAWVAARDAVLDAACDSARDAAWDAAWDAEIDWQTERLRWYLDGTL